MFAKITASPLYAKADVPAIYGANHSGWEGQHVDVRHEGRADNILDGECPISPPIFFPFQ
jgi:hypothetical protein